MFFELFRLMLQKLKKYFNSIEHSSWPWVIQTGAELVIQAFICDVLTLLNKCSSHQESDQLTAFTEPLSENEANSLKELSYVIVMNLLDSSLNVTLIKKVIRNDTLHFKKYNTELWADKLEDLFI